MSYVAWMALAGVLLLTMALAAPPAEEVVGTNVTPAALDHPAVAAGTLLSEISRSATPRSESSR